MYLVLFALIAILTNFVHCCDLDQLADWAATLLQILANNASAPCEVLSGGYGSPQDHRPHIFLFQSDEHEVLADWLQYHSYLVGLQNIHIVDQNSHNLQICKLLALYKLCGVDITMEENFVNKHTALTERMKLYNDSFLIPMDADEFVSFPVTPTEFTTDRHTIIEQFANLSIDGRKYKFSNVAARYPAADCKITTKTKAFDPTYRRVTKKATTSGASQYPPHMLKTFFYSDGFIATDQGNHHGIVAHDAGHNMSRDPLVKGDLSHYFQFTNISLVHFFASSYFSMRQKILRAVKAYGFTTATNCDKITSNGVQYCRLAKTYQAASVASYVHYLQNCRIFDPTKKGASKLLPIVSLSSFSDWFVEHAKSFAELIGEELVVDNYM